MTVKQFLGSYNIGRSKIKQAVVVDVEANALDIEEQATYTYTERELREDLYGKRFGDLKINTFTITEDKIVIYAR